MGKPLSILAKINNIETPICLDTGAGANAINTNYLKKLGINPIATKIFEKPIAIEVGNSQTTSVTETVLLQLHTKEHVSYVWFLKIDELPIKAILGYTSATILNITMQSGGEIYWDKEHIPKTDIPVVGEVMKERRRRERERLINLSTCGCVIQLYLWENTQFIEIREFGWGFLMLTS